MQAVRRGRARVQQRAHRLRRIGFACHHERRPTIAIHLVGVSPSRKNKPQAAEVPALDSKHCRVAPIGGALRIQGVPLHHAGKQLHHGLVASGGRGHERSAALVLARLTG